MVAGTDPGCVCSLAAITHCLPMLMFAELQFCVSSVVHILFACKELPGEILESNEPSHNMQNTNGMIGVHNRVLSIKRRASALYWPNEFSKSTMFPEFFILHQNIEDALGHALSAYTCLPNLKNRLSNSETCDSGSMWSPSFKASCEVYACTMHGWQCTCGAYQGTWGTDGSKRL